MTGGRVLPLNPDAHAAVLVLLPWYVNGRLDGPERAEVEAHLAGCPRCQAELEVERRLQAAHQGLETPGDVERGLAALRERMDAPQASAKPARRRFMPRWLDHPPALRALLALQLAIVALLGGLLLLPPEPDGAYKLLGSPAAAAGGNVLVKFRPEATEADIRGALRASGARLAGGPTATDAYLLAVPDGQESTAVKRLRADRAVLLAESLAPGERR